MKYLNNVILQIFCFKLLAYSYKSFGISPCRTKHVVGCYNFLLSPISPWRVVSGYPRIHTFRESYLSCGELHLTWIIFFLTFF